MNAEVDPPGPTANRHRRGLAIAVVAVAALAAGAWTAWRREAPAAAVDTAPFYQQQLKDGAGMLRSMADYRGHPVLVNFWATWCVPCVKEIPVFSRVHADDGAKVAFVGLGIDSADNVAAFTERFKPSYPLVAAGASGTELARALGDPTGALPFTVLLDAEGRVVASHLGQLDETTLRGWLAR